MTDPWTAPHELRFGAPLPDGETTLRWRGTALMGVVNVTPDSFSDGGALSATAVAVEHGLRLRAQGALVIDVGGESTRPGAAPVGAAEELKRIMPTIEGLADAGVLVSVDTRKPEVAERALAAGARIVNDIAGLSDPAMRQVCAAAGAPAVLMHMRGEPRTMQDEPLYEDVVAEVLAFLSESAERALAVIEALGCQRVVAGAGESECQTVAGVERCCERFAEAAEALAERGLRFGLHNHWWEYEPVDGVYPYRLMLERLPHEVFFEVDVYWVQTAAVDPIAVLREMAGRARLLHVKDGPALVGQPMVPAGQGSLDIAGIVRANAANSEALIVEFDECATPI